MDPQDPFDQVEPKCSSDGYTIDKINKKLFSILKLIVIIPLISFALLYTFYLILWIMGTNTIVQPFEIGVTSDAGHDFHGGPITDLLCFEIRRIEGINGQDQVQRSSGSFTTIPPDNALKSETTEGGTGRSGNNYTQTRSSIISSVSLGTFSAGNSISQIGNVGMGGTTLSLGQIILSLKELTHHQGRTITGSLQKYGSNLSLVAILSDPDSDREKIKAWEVKQNLPKDNSSIEEFIPGMVEDLAFQIDHDINKEENQRQDKLYPQTWQAYKYASLGLEAYRAYNATGKDEDLDVASSMALSAKNSEPDYPGPCELLFNLGFDYLKKDQYAKANDLFRNITDLRPAESAFGLGMVCAKQGLYNDAIDNFNKAIELNHSYDEAWYNKGLALIDLENYDEAIKAFNEDIRLNPDNADAWGNKGQALNQVGRYDEALQALNKTIELNPKDAGAWGNKANSLARLDNYKGALQASQKAIDLNPKLAFVWNNMGWALYKLDKKIEALDALNNSTDLDPGYQLAWINKGIILEDLGRHNESNNAYAHVFVIKADSLARLGFYDRSLSASNEAINQTPNLASAWNNKGWALYKLGKTYEALDSLNNSIKLDPKYELAWINKGIILEDLGRYNESIKACDKVIMINPQNAFAWYYKGQALRKVGKDAEANTAFIKAKKLGYVPQVP